MKDIYTAEIKVNGVKGVVGGNSADDLAEGVRACTQAIEQATEIPAPSGIATLIIGAEITAEVDECDINRQSREPTP